MNNIVYPNYNHCILNTITSILKYYNVDNGHSSLKNLDDILNKKDYKNVILIVLDGMGENVYKPITNSGFFAKNDIDCLTSVYPSTTTAALTTYYAGKPPYETGWIAWSQYFKEYGRALDMLSHTESYKKDSLAGAKIDVFQDVVKYIPIFEQIENASSVKAYEVTPSYSDRRSKRSMRADNIDDMLDSILMLCNNNDTKKFIMGYSDEPDHTLHLYGTDSEEVNTMIKSFEEKISKMCDNLPDDSIVIISADHGHKNIEKVYSILDFPELLECMYMPASFEARLLNFFIKENMKDQFVERFNSIFKDEFMLMSKEDFLNKNLLGYGNKHPKIDDFIGNYLAISTGSSMIRLETYLAEGKKIRKSTHCGMTKEEMEVPLIVYAK